MPAAIFMRPRSSIDQCGTTGAVADGGNVDLHRYAFVHFLDVGDHADAAAQGLEAVQRFHGQGQGVWIELPKPRR